jgi:hypothetical protein
MKVLTGRLTLEERRLMDEQSRNRKMAPEAERIVSVEVRRLPVAVSAAYNPVGASTVSTQYKGGCGGCGRTH